ncbi:hypothetical protein QS713_06470 [Gleimia hominis]|uniref:Phosphatidylinositol mannoside acyltransferase n=1 Tax=Gleimia hominis TaxID=595468 RepID=A0ABU3IDZ6_9ACTO|nr:hypothetical protein [Gleimia hominis]MDT3767707.1 hypothetical protein [Gleimia hominis]
MDLTLSLFQAAAHLTDATSEAVGYRIGRAVGQLNNASNTQLSHNLKRIDPTLNKRDIREAVARYLCMFAQTPHLHKMSQAQLGRAVDIPRTHELRAHARRGQVIIALTHSGNWDMAGAYAHHYIAPVVTVAEELASHALFEYFTRTRADVGIEILPARHGIFNSLLEAVKNRHVLVPLLADRDITGRGVQVQWFDRLALVAAGPAALAHRLNAPLYAGYVTGRLYREGSRRRMGYRVHLIPVKLGADVAQTSQRWVSALEPVMRGNPLDWHMMQKLFVEDLDLQRLERARRKVQEAQ